MHVARKRAKRVRFLGFGGTRFVAGSREDVQGDRAQ